MPVECVQEVVRYHEITRVPLMPPTIRGLINLRGQIVMAVDLRRRFGMGERMDSQPPVTVVVRNAESAVGFLVDEIGDVIEVDEDSFESTPQTVQGPGRDIIRGIYRREGQLLQVFDIVGACQSVEVEQPAEQRLVIPG